MTAAVADARVDLRLFSEHSDACVATVKTPNAEPVSVRCRTGRPGGPRPVTWICSQHGELAPNVTCQHARAVRDALNHRTENR